MREEICERVQDNNEHNKESMAEASEALRFVGGAACVFRDVSRLIEDNLKKVEDASRIWECAVRKMKSMLDHNARTVKNNDDAIYQAEMILVLNEVVMQEHWAELSKHANEIQLLENILEVMDNVPSQPTLADSSQGDD
ncbi:conserved hypothetical protein [Neospora caninum Liverpool]|uniref:Uncharacterized protein n=1 Tax=Neospora caninum (strain Liverpool) TaxID=572307 RepID=F0VQE7_NEOCL|nr:conserved hypothetical protein [Neospora caninum Liverpool]CBZ55944.1 conserved hypothetical protein [Neospora caninum Liverpool]CEL70690.1 TPA: hypothetical protein BN1204_063700 [Neospora caninum Liverpool]|eukprot:XP_003885970.1 conserved hypothetical protein [Neospora caninum Liverpool]